MVMYMRCGHKTELLLPQIEAETYRSGLVFGMTDLQRKAIRISGFMATPLIVKREINIIPNELIGVEITDCPQIEFEMPDAS
jgi:hypothetical protein